MRVRYVRDHKIASGIAAAIVVAAVVVVVAGFGFGSPKTAGGISQATCNQVLPLFRKAQADVQSSGYEDLQTAADNAITAVFRLNGSSSKFSKDLSTLEHDAGLLSTGVSNDTSYVTADLQVVYTDCGQTYPTP